LTLATDVISPDEIYLDGIRYPLSGAVNVSLVSIFPPKVTIGDFTRDTEQLASSWIFSDFKGGMLVLRMDVSTQQDRLYFLTADGRFTKQIILPPLANQAGPSLTTTVAVEQSAISLGLTVATDTGDLLPSPPFPILIDNETEIVTAKDGDVLVTTRAADGSSAAVHSVGAVVNTRTTGTREVSAGVDYNSTLYVAFAEKIRYWLEGATMVGRPSELTYGDLDSAATDGASLRIGDTDWLVFCSGSQYIRYDGTTWSIKTGDGSTLPEAKYLTVWDGRLWALDTDNTLWVTADLTAANDGWAKKAQMPVLFGEVSALDTFFNADEAEKVVATTKTGLWIYDDANDKWFRTRLSFPHHTHGGRGHVLYQGDFYLTAGVDAYRFTGATVIPVGLNRDNGLPADYRGTIDCLADAFNWLMAGMNGAIVESETDLSTAPSGYDTTVFGDSAGLAAIFAWTGTGWFTFWTSGTAGSQIQWMKMSPAGGTNRLWFGANQELNYIPLPQGVFNPLEEPGWEFGPSGYFETPWFDAGWAELDKLALEVKARAEQITTDETITLKYAIDEAQTWTTLGTLSGSTNEDTFEFDNAAGIVFRNIRFRGELARGTDTTKTPVFRFAALKFLRLLDPLFGYNLTVDLSQPYSGRSPWEMLVAIKATLAKKTLVDFEFRRAGESILSGKIKPSQAHASTYTGIEEGGRFELALVEV
jgi:hypothetical protein